MARRIKPLIIVFWEGESEQAYTKYLKTAFEDVAVIRLPSNSGLFLEAKNMFKNNPKYRNNAEVTDEIWFFFDTELEKAAHWDRNYKIINELRKLRKSQIKIRLLMTTACMEYWMLLHLTAIENGKWTLISLEHDGLPSVGDTDDRNCWLFQGTHTFTTVHEAIEFLIELKS